MGFNSGEVLGSGIKRCAVVRFGAFGDMIIASPVFRRIKEDGYKVTLITTERGKEVVKHDPNIDRIVCINVPEGISDQELNLMVAKHTVNHDKVVNLSQSLEVSLLKVEGTKEWFWSKDRIHKACNINYYDYALQKAGYNDTGKLGMVYFSPTEHQDIRQVFRKHKGKYIILWALAGSAYHKAYPYAEYVARDFLARHEDSVIYTVGDVVAHILEWYHPRTKNVSGVWSIRKSLLATKYASLVIGPETGVLNAAGCFDTPKITFLSHSSTENLTKYWQNNTDVVPHGAPCHPCHKLIKNLEDCPLEGGIKAPICTSKIPKKYVLDLMEEKYQEWRKNRGHRV